MKNNNIIFLLSLGILLILISCYLLLFAPDLYRAKVMFETVGEYNAYLAALNREPITPDEFSKPTLVQINTAVPRGQHFPYGEKQALKTVFGLSCLAVGIISLACIGMELGKQKGSTNSRLGDVL